MIAGLLSPRAVFPAALVGHCCCVVLLVAALLAGATLPSASASASEAAAAAPPSAPLPHHRPLRQPVPPASPSSLSYDQWAPAAHWRTQFDPEEELLKEEQDRPSARRVAPRATGASPTATITAVVEISIPVTPTITASQSPASSLTTTPSPSASESPMPTFTISPSPSASESPVPTSISPSPSASESPLPTSTTTPSPSASDSPMSTISPSPSSSPSAPQSPLPTTSALPSLTPTRSASRSPSSLSSRSPTPSVTPAISASLSPSSTRTPSPSASPVPRTQLTINNDTGAAALSLYASGASAAATSATNTFGDLLLRAPNGSEIGSVAFPLGGFAQETFTTADGREVTQLQAALGGGASKLGLEYVFFDRASETSFAGVTVANAKGTFKYSVNITGGWPFSGDASASDGFSLPITLDIDALITTVVVKADTPVARVSTYVFYAASLGVRYELQLLDVAIVDGADGQPTAIGIAVSHEATSSNSTRISLTLSFPRFESSLSYDPSLGLLYGRSPDGGSSSGGGLDSGLIGGLVGGLVGAAVVVVVVVIVAALVVSYLRRRKSINLESAVAFGAEDVEMEPIPSKRPNKKSKASDKTWWDDTDNA